MSRGKHKKAWRQRAARLGFITHAWRLRNRLSRSGRITFLRFQGVGSGPGEDFLPSHEKLPKETFDDLLRRLARSFEMIGLKEAVRRLAAGEGGRNAVVITLDGGYRDHKIHALPVLEKHGIPATVFLEAGALDRRSLGWIQKYLFIEKSRGSAFFAGEFIRMTADSGMAKRLAEEATLGGDMVHTLKEILKYEIDGVERDRITDEIFKSVGGDEQELLEASYMSWEDVKAMAGDRVAFGCHTLNHPILSSMTREEARVEIMQARRLIEARTGLKVDTFAYPFGRSWDFNEETIEVLREEGFICGLAVEETSHLPGRADLFRLGRYPLDGRVDLAGLVAEASGLCG